MDAWTEFWKWASENQLGATLVGGVILLAIAALASRIPRIGLPLRRFFSRAWAWRPVSSRRLEYELRALREELIEPIDGGDDNPLSRQVREWGDEMAKLASSVTALSKEQFEQNAEVAALTARPPASIPAPDPRWVLTRSNARVGSFDRYTIQNLIPGSFAYNVRLDNGATGAVTLGDKAFFEDLSGEASGIFLVRVDRIDSDGEAAIKVSWVNQSGAALSETLYIKGDERRGYGF